MSDTPQPNPWQGAGPNDPNSPTQPVPPPAPVWGAAPQVPGQLPPTLPAQPPGPPSAWTQQLPPTPPQYGPPTVRRPRGGARPWLIGGGAVVLAAAVIAGVIIATSGNDGPGAAPGAPGDAAKPAPAAGGKAYTHVPDGCALVRPATVESLVPGAACKPGQLDNATMAAMITRTPKWDRPFGSGGDYAHLDVDLDVGPSVQDMYDMRKKSILKVMGDVATITDSRSLSGLGDEAYAVVAADKPELGNGAQAHVIVRAGNAAFAVEYAYTARSGPAKTQQQLVDAATTAARDVLGSLG